MENIFNESSAPRKQRKSKERLRRARSYNNTSISHQSKAELLNLGWSGQTVVPPHRVFSNHESSFASYPVHVGYAMDPCQYPVYSPIIPPSSPNYYPVAPVRRTRRNDVSRAPHFGITRKFVNLSEQEFTSLPPANHDAYSDKSSDSESNSKRHFSDPGVGPESLSETDDCESSRNPMYVNLVEEVRILKESRQGITKELTSLQEQIRNITTSGCGVCAAASYQPGGLTDAISELRKASVTREDSLLAKLDAGVEATLSKVNKTLEDFSNRLTSLELKFNTIDMKDNPSNATLESNDLTEVGADGNQLALKTLEEEKICLENQLKEAQLGRTEAEANTQKLERLVAILRTKINGLSSESCFSEISPPRPPITIDKNPFIIMDTVGKSPKVSAEGESIIVPISKNGVPTVPAKPSSLLPPNHSTSLPKDKPNPPSLLPAKPNISQLPKPVSGPIIPPRPAYNSSKLVNIENGGSKESEVSLESATQLSPQVNFVIGRAVTSSGGSDLKRGYQSESNADSVTSATTSLGGTLTIMGPVTDL